MRCHLMHGRERLARTSGLALRGTKRGQAELDAVEDVDRSRSSEHEQALQQEHQVHRLGRGAHVRADLPGRLAALDLRLEPRPDAVHPVAHGRVSDPIRVVDEAMRDVPADGETMGEVVMRGNNVRKGYFEGSAATATAFTGRTARPQEGHRHIRRGEHLDD
jgi:acyl-CoA synthetase (AMP-forming)/AMP-acid ligase II